MILDPIKPEVKILKQEINLHDLLPKKTGMYLTGGVVISSYLMFFLILMVFYFIVTMQKNKSEVLLTDATQQYAIVQKQLTELNAKYPISDPAHLQDSLKDMQNQLTILSNEINLLSTNAVFSSYLEGIANSAVIGAWLKEFSFNRNDSNMVLKGLVIQHALLEQFLNNLNRQPVFKNLVFGLQDFTESTVPASFTIITKQTDLS